MSVQDPFPKDITDLLLESKAAAKQKKYEEALARVCGALRIAEKIEAPARQMISLLDYRHAIYVRKDDLDASLKDAKSMVRLDRTDARGYIRCAAVEKLCSHPSAALKYLEHGVRSVTASDANLPLLNDEIKTLRDQITADLVASRPKDPLAILPLEILELILSYIDFRQNIRMLRVSRSWKRLLSQIRPLTEVLSFPGSRKHITPKMLLSSLRRLKIPKIVKLTALTPPAATILEDRLRRSPAFNTLQSFEINDATIKVQALPITQWRLRTLVLDTDTSCDANLVQQVLQSCSNLLVAKFRNVDDWGKRLALCSQSLIELEVAHAGGSSPHFGSKNRKVELNLPQIKKLSLSAPICCQVDQSLPLDLSHMEQLQTLTLNKCFLTNLLLPPSLRHLEMTMCIFVYQEVPIYSMPTTSFPALDNLETLNILDSKRMAGERVPYPPFLRHAITKGRQGGLSSFSFSIENALAEDFVTMMTSPWFRGLTNLRIGDRRTIKDQQSQVLLDNCPNLETLQLEAASITGVFLSDLIRAESSKLRKITLSTCNQVSRDIVPWARERGVEIEFVNGLEVMGHPVREYH